MKYTNTEIEEKANNLLNSVLLEVFAQNSKIIGPHPSKLNHEIGIDYFFEIRDRKSGESLNIIFNQNKGTERISVIKSKTHPEYGKISYPLKLRHAKYFINELNKPLFFTICDLKLDKIYWYWIQLDNTIQARIETQETKKKKNLQIYIPVSNELNLNNFERFYTELEKSDRIQTHKLFKSKLSTESDYDFKDIEESDLHIIDKIIASIKKFDGLTIIPKHILRRMYPFKGTKDKTYIFSETLYTDNQDIYNLFKALERENEVLRIKKDYEASISIIGFENKLKEVLDFLKVNLIYHFEWSGKEYKDRICIHNLFDYGNTCDCERCNYNRLNFKRASLKLEEKKLEESSIEKFKKAYTFYLLGDLKRAYSLYKEVNIDTKNNENPILNTLCKFNLINLKNLITNHYFEHDRNQILDELKEINFVFDEISIRQNYYRDVFEWIKENQFINGSIWEIDRLFVEIQNHHRKDKNGGYFRGKQSYNFKFEFLRISFFIQFNLIIYDIFNEFQILVHKSLESMFALYNIFNPDSTKYDKFEFTFLYNWLMYANSSKANNLLLKYNIDEIELNDEVEVYKRFNENLDNLIISKNKINVNKENYLFRDKVKNIIQNFVFILSRIKMNKTNLNVLIKKYIDLIILLKDDYLISLIKFETLFHYRNDINITNTRKILKILGDNELFETQSFNKCFDYYLLIQNFKTRDLKLDKFIPFLDKRSDEKSIENDFYLNFSKYESILKIDKLKKEIISLVQTPALKRLKNNFNPQYFYRLSIYDVIPYEKNLFSKYIMSIKDLTKKPSGYELISGMKQRKNYDLNQLINLIYKYNLPFTDEIRKLSKYAHEKDYYDWLMNLEGFDYSKFNHYWILEYKTIIYFKEFRKHKKLKSEVKKALEKNYIEGVAKIYINHFD